MEIKDKIKVTEELMEGEEVLLRWLLDKRYYEYPAAMSHHSNYIGGLFDHSLQVTYELIKLTTKLGLKWERPQSPAIVGMLHDVCKLDDYLIGQQIENNRDKSYPGHGEKSIIMLAGLIDLTEEEKMCIRYHMGAFTDQEEWRYYSRAVREYPNVLYTHTADMIASQIKGI